MTDIKKYIKVANVFLIMLVLGALLIHLFLSKYINILSLVINIVVIGIILLILFSITITYFILNDKKINKSLMIMNYSIIRCIFPIMSKVGKFVGISKDEIRKFLLSIDLLYSKYTMIQNQIINNVMIIEGILINSENSIKQNFTLKTGIILNHYLNTKSNKANSEKFKI